MNTREVFYKPGLETPQEIIDGLMPCPREVHLKGLRFSMLWRIFVFAAAVICMIFILRFLLLEYVSTTLVRHLVIAAILFPIVFLFLPWQLFTGHKRHLQSFRYFEKVYKNGTACKGNIVMLTHILNNDQASHYDAAHTGMLLKTRVDYTFQCGKELKTGSVILHSLSAQYLGLNDEICVLYNPEQPEENILFPIPGNDLFTLIKT